MHVAVILICLALSCRASEECGKRPPLPRVLGGEEAFPHSWPWQAMIEVKNRKDAKWQHKCGGSLIHSEWIVTAAHCLAFSPDPRIYRIVLGLYIKNTRQHNRQHMSVQTSSLLPGSKIQFSGFHGDKWYNSLWYTYCRVYRKSNDMILNFCDGAKGVSGSGVYVDTPSGDENAVVGVVSAIARGKVKGKVLEFNVINSLTSWGFSKSGNNTKAQKLQQAQMPTVNYSTCSEGNSFFQPIDDQSMLCAGFGGSSPISGCNGDSGGPFVCPEDGRFVLRGAVSWGIPGCPAGKTYSVFTRISSFVDWIKDHMKNSDNY
ncbi:plasminogen-like [Orbicella faveolata]|uniref:plasminogen-like n=1 Tax=Orbicella faveolata TaxID=48498 RepID=UPI0009E47734|nr:plasminogen-like [Orbicella faveolata]